MSRLLLLMASAITGVDLGIEGRTCGGHFALLEKQCNATYVACESDVKGEEDDKREEDDNYCSTALTATLDSDDEFNYRCYDFFRCATTNPKCEEVAYCISDLKNTPNCAAWAAFLEDRCMTATTACAADTDCAAILKDARAEDARFLQDGCSSRTSFDACTKNGNDACREVTSCAAEEDRKALPSVLSACDDRVEYMEAICAQKFADCATSEKCSAAVDVARNVLIRKNKEACTLSIRECDAAECTAILTCDDAATPALTSDAIADFRDDGDLNNSIGSELLTESMRTTITTITSSTTVRYEDVGIEGRTCGGLMALVEKQCNATYVACSSDEDVCSTALNATLASEDKWGPSCKAHWGCDQSNQNCSAFVNCIFELQHTPSCAAWAAFVDDRCMTETTACDDDTDCAAILKDARAEDKQDLHEGCASRTSFDACAKSGNDACRELTTCAGVADRNATLWDCDDRVTFMEGTSSSSTTAPTSSSSSSSSTPGTDSSSSTAAPGAASSGVAPTITIINNNKNINNNNNNNNNPAALSAVAAIVVAAFALQ